MDHPSDLGLAVLSQSSDLYSMLLCFFPIAEYEILDPETVFYFQHLWEMTTVCESLSQDCVGVK